MAFQCVVRNFLAAEEVKFTIKGLTIIQGASSSGKSSSLKALYAACTNTFSPSQVRWHSDAATIKIRFSKDEPILTVVRSRKGSPTMQFNGKEYSKIARTVPKEIEEYLNIGFIQVGSEKYCLNFFTQFQPPLLHVFSQRRIAEILSSSSALDDFNIVSKALANRKEQLKGSFNSIDTLMTEIKERIQPDSQRLEKEKPLQESLSSLYIEYLALEKSEEQIKTLVDQSVNFSRKSLLISQRRRLKDVYAEVNELCDLQDLLLSIKDNVRCVLQTGRLLSLRKDLKMKLDSLQEVEDSRSLLTTCKESMISLNVVDDRLINLKLKVAVYDSADEKMLEYETISNSRYSIQDYLSKVQRLRHLQERIQFNKTMIGKDTCPFCGSKTNQDMNRAEILAKRKALEDQILSDEKEISVLESKIQESAQKLGIAPDLTSIEAALQEKTELLQQKEKQIADILSNIEKIEKGQVAPIETALPQIESATDSKETIQTYIEEVTASDSTDEDELE